MRMAYRVDVPFLGVSVRAGAAVGHIFIGGKYTESNKRRGTFDDRRVIGLYFVSVRAAWQENVRA